MTDTLTPRELRHLREAAGSLEYQAAVSSNGGSQSNADKFKDRAYAIRKALRLLEPAPTNVVQAVVAHPGGGVDLWP